MVEGWRVLGSKDERLFRGEEQKWRRSGCTA